MKNNQISVLDKEWAFYSGAAWLGASCPVPVSLPKKPNPTQGTASVGELPRGGGTAETYAGVTGSSGYNPYQNLQDASKFTRARELD